MNKTVSDTFEVQLRARRDELFERLHRHRGGVRGRAEAAADKREQAGDEAMGRDESFDLGTTLGEREAGELQAIERALQRVADGSYGLCLQCGAPIPAARLHAQPTAERCVSCQAAAE
jgi:DnaK suppressor protein